MKVKPKHYHIACERCGRIRKTNLPTAAYCSNACRQAAYRQRKKESALVEIVSRKP